MECLYNCSVWFDDMVNVSRKDIKAIRKYIANLEVELAKTEHGVKAIKRFYTPDVNRACENLFLRT
jgi:hypothetical protein